jgi:hypothetical protein
MIYRVPSSIPQALPIYNMTAADVPILEEALRLLGSYVRQDYVSVMVKLEGVAYGAQTCGPNALACVGGNRGRVATLAHRPSKIGTIETAVLLRHEAHHIVLLDDGGYGIFPHTCFDCSNPFERAYDPIYTQDEAVRACLVECVRAEGHRRRVQAAAQIAAARAAAARASSVQFRAFGYELANIYTSP